MIAAFGLLWLLGAAQLGMIQSWRQIAALLAGLVVISAVLTSRGWLWAEIGQPIFGAVVAVGGEIAAPSGRCSAGSGTSSAATTWRIQDETDYQVARDLQAADPLGGSGQIGQSGGGSTRLRTHTMA